MEVTPGITTYGDIIKIVCEKSSGLDPSRYYIGANNEIELEDQLIFQRSHANYQLQMLKKTKYILEDIAEQSMLNDQQLKQKAEIENKNHISASYQLGQILESTIKKIPREDVQKYLHEALNKSFDIVLLGSPRVGKSTLINAILKKDAAQTSAGRNSCTSEMNYYEYKESYSTLFDHKSTIASTCSIRIWDMPGIEDWTKFDVAKFIQELVKEKNPICVIFCTSPGCYTDLNHVRILIEECKRLNVFIALIVTNMLASDETDEILTTYQNLLGQHSAQTKAEDNIFYYGSIGLCTAVNSVEFTSQDKTKGPQGVDELMLGVMSSLSDEKLLQWCFALMDNGPFWIRSQGQTYKNFNFARKFLDY